jgi:hypothetical protein
MTQTPEPLDLDAVQQRWDVFTRGWTGYAGVAACANDVPALIAEIRRLQQMLHPAQEDQANGWRALVRQQIAELAAKDALIKNLEEASAAQQIEIERLQVLLNEAHADADELLYPSSTRGGWVGGEGATDAYTHTCEVTEIPEAGITLTYESWGPA